MTFVPAARCRLEGFLGPQSDCSLGSPLLVDRFEVSRRDWLGYLEGRGDLLAVAPESWGPQNPETLDWPATATFHEAGELARRRGMRLPTPEEWIHVAVGGRGQAWPWGTTFQASIANTLELGLERPASVGSFESGQSQPFGCYDLLGNVWEWVDGRVRGRADAQELTFGLDGGFVSAMGGSFLYRAEETFGVATESGLGSIPVFHALALDPRTRSNDVGLRCVADAEAYLRQRSRDLGGGARAEERLRALGARWGRDAWPLLQALAAEAGAAPQLRFLEEGARP